jgi:hypothetical protein
MANKTCHWTERKKWSDAWHAAVLCAVIDSNQKPNKPYQKSKVNITFYGISLMDKDGSYNSAKPVIDGLRYAGVIYDDSEKYITLSVKQKKVGHQKEEKIEIEIYGR